MLTKPVEARFPRNERRDWSSEMALIHMLIFCSCFSGPNLNGLFGRQSGTTPGYSYSTANKNMAVIWEESTLYDYLLNPKKVLATPIHYLSWLFSLILYLMWGILVIMFSKILSFFQCSSQICRTIFCMKFSVSFFRTFFFYTPLI